MSRKQKKSRPDSSIGSLPAEARAAVDRMLLGGAPAREVQAYLKEEHKLDLSTTSIYGYYHTHLGNVRLAEMKSIAETLCNTPTEGMSEAIRHRVIQTAFELSLAPNTDPATLSQLVKLVQNGERIGILRRQLELTETRAAEALLDKAKSPEVQAIVNGNASHAAKLAALRPLLFGQYEPIDPTATAIK